jgi:hypothetical protein
MSHLKNKVEKEKKKLGQYYKIIDIDKKEELPLDGCIKLMEHSYLGSDNSGSLRRRLEKETGKWAGDRVLQIGDYAESEIYLDSDGKPKKGRETLYEAFRDYEKECRMNNSLERDSLYSMKVKPVKLTAWNNGKAPRYAVDTDRMEWTDLWAQPCEDFWLDEKTAILYPTVIDALELLIAIGNGQGGGDYSGLNEKQVGRWAFDHIYTLDDKSKIPGDCKKISYCFSEKYDIADGNNIDALRMTYIGELGQINLKKENSALLRKLADGKAKSNPNYLFAKEIDGYLKNHCYLGIFHIID